MPTRVQDPEGDRPAAEVYPRPLGPIGPPEVAPRDERGRRLTPAEAALIDALLGSEEVTDRERMQRSGLSHSTYEAAHRRVLTQGWIVERYLPNPVAFGKPYISFALARYRDAVDPESLRRWAAFEGAAVLWAGGRTVFGVFLSGRHVANTPLTRELARTDRYEATYALEADLREATVPVYFDFEAEWSRVCGMPGTTGYPRSLPVHPLPGANGGAPRVPERWQRTVEEIVRIDIGPQGPGGSPHGPFYRLGRRGVIRRALEQGWIDRRTFLDLASLPGYRDWTLAQAVFVHGTLRPNASAEALFRTLTGRCEVAPFLFATNAKEVFFASLAPPPVGAFIDPGRPSVSGTLERFVDPLVVHREPVRGLKACLNHRYDGLVGGANA